MGRDEGAVTVSSTKAAMIQVVAMPVDGGDLPAGGVSKLADVGAYNTSPRLRCEAGGNVVVFEKTWLQNEPARLYVWVTPLPRGNKRKRGS
jgi:hypothetical protein